MKLALLGDIAVFEDGLLNTEYRENFREVSEYLANFDYVVANLEAPITDRKRTLVCKGMHLRTSSKIAELLKYLHVNAVCLSNNHTYDFGKAGIRDTQKTLESNDIAFFGVNGKTLDVNVANEKLKF